MGDVTENKRIVWIKCRSVSETSGDQTCSGNQAEVVSKLNFDNGFGHSGNMSRYRCLTCRRLFAIRV